MNPLTKCTNDASYEPTVDELCCGQTAINTATGCIYVLHCDEVTGQKEIIKNCPSVVLGGCTSSTALNYNPDATFNDGSCVEPPAIPETTTSQEPSNVAPTVSANPEPEQVPRQGNEGSIPGGECDTTRYPGVLRNKINPTSCDILDNTLTKTYLNGGTVFYNRMVGIGEYSKIDVYADTKDTNTFLETVIAINRGPGLGIIGPQSEAAPYYGTFDIVETGRFDVTSFIAMVKKKKLSTSIPIPSVCVDDVRCFPYFNGIHIGCFPVRLVVNGHGGSAGQDGEGGTNYSCSWKYDIWYDSPDTTGAIKSIQLATAVVLTGTDGIPKQVDGDIYHCQKRPAIGRLTSATQGVASLQLITPAEGGDKIIAPIIVSCNEVPDVAVCPT